MKGISRLCRIPRRKLSRTAILQRVTSASVTVDTHLISSIGKGVLVFAAVAPEDTRKEVESMAAKVLKMKLWPDKSDRTVCSRNWYTISLSDSYDFRSGSKTYRKSREKFFVVGHQKKFRKPA